MPGVARKVELTPSADAVARCVLARQGVTFQARGRRRLRVARTVTLVLVPLKELQHGPTTSDWLVWEDGAGRGAVGTLPAGGTDIANTLGSLGDEGDVVSSAVRQVMDALWELIAD